MKNMTKMFMGISFGLVIFSGVCGMIPKSLTPSAGDVHYPPLHNYVKGVKAYMRVNDKWVRNDAASRPADSTDNRQSDGLMSSSQSQPKDLINNHQLNASIQSSRSQPNHLDIQGQQHDGDSNQDNQETASGLPRYINVGTNTCGAPQTQQIICNYNIYVPAPFYGQNGNCDFIPVYSQSSNFRPVPFYSQSSNFSPVPAYGQSNNYGYRQDVRRFQNYDGRGYNHRQNDWYQRDDNRRQNDRHQENDQ